MFSCTSSATCQRVQKSSFHRLFCCFLPFLKQVSFLFWTLHVLFCSKTSKWQLLYAGYLLKGLPTPWPLLQNPPPDKHHTFSLINVETLRNTMSAVCYCSFKHVDYWSCCVKLATRWHWKFNLTLKLVIQGKRYFKAGFINKGAEFHRKIIYLCINCTDIVDDLLYFILWKQESTSNDTNWTNVCFLSLIIQWFSVYFRFFYCHISFTNWNYLTLTVCYRSTTDATQGQFVIICLLFFF